MPGLESNIGVDIPATIDQRLDARRVTQPVSGNAVDREAVVLADPVGVDDIARVLSANPTAADLGLVIRSVRGFAAGTPEFTDLIDRALRDIGKVDIAGFDASLPAGPNNIGDVDVLTLPALVASTARIGRVEFNTPTIANLTSAVVSVAASGDNTLVAGIGGQTIRIWKLLLVFNAAVNIIFKDGAATNLTGVMNMLANGSFVLDFDAEPWFLTAAANAFILNLSAAVQVSGRIYYTQSA